MSERSARRIMDGQIAPLAPLLARISSALSAQQNSDKQLSIKVSNKHEAKDARGLKIAQNDAAVFTNGIQAAFRNLARDYYLQDDVEPTIRVAKDALHISIPLIKLR